MATLPGMGRVNLEELNYEGTGETKKGFAKTKTGKKTQISPYIATSRHQKIHLYRYATEGNPSVKSIIVHLIDNMDEILNEQRSKEYDPKKNEEKRQLSVMLPTEQVQKLTAHRIKTGESIPKVISMLIDSLPKTNGA